MTEQHGLLRRDEPTRFGPPTNGGAPPVASGPPPEVRWAGATRAGRVRPRNEDRWRVLDDHLFAVADGIGGLPGGDVAAAAAVDALCDAGPRRFDVAPHELARFVHDSVVGAGLRSGVRNLGTTVAALGITGDRVVFFAMGDSRVYRLRHGLLRQLTVDHNRRTDLLAAGERPDDAERRGVRTDALTSYLGAPRDLRRPVSVGSLPAEDGDRYLVSTDGVHGYVEPRALAQLVARADPDGAVTGLLDAADHAGGRDNATAIVVDLVTRADRSSA